MACSFIHCNSEYTYSAKGVCVCVWCAVCVCGVFVCVSHRDAVFLGAEGQKRILSGRGKNLPVEYLEADYTIRSDFHCYQGFCRCHRLVGESIKVFFLGSSSAYIAKDGVKDSTNCRSVQLLFRLSSWVIFCKLFFQTTLFVSSPSILLILQHLHIVI